ncbi:hypothetical protein [Paenibacillus sp. LPE1-1-1.1]|uniref:hypothetical protein n=1 Tax=Paenibacillus sp. LPE1-1-1.1 TaxID=3135230 RepID=UPI003423AF72
MKWQPRPANGQVSGTTRRMTIYSLSEDFQYNDSYFIVGFLIMAGVIIYNLLRKKK